MSLPTQKRELLPEQATAAYEIKKHISVTAGPGSGKTMVLVERYLHILREHNLNIDQIVAITFTNRAANEMRERLRGRLNQILRDASGDERKHWLHYKRTLDGAVITTIHGFCARLLREFPVEARVDPQFLLLDEHRAAMLLESVVEEVLREFIVAGHIEISQLTLGVGRGKLAAALAQLYRDARGQGLKPEGLAMKTARSHATEDDHSEALVELSRAINDFLACRRTTAAARGNQADVSAAWADLWPLLQTIPTVEGLADYCRIVEAFRSVRPQARGDLKPYVQALDALIWEKDLAGRVPQISLDIFAKQYALEMAQVLRRIDERLNEEKQKLSALDFDDLELRALELLERPEVLTRAAERYKFFLVDEFQDTNGLQRRLLEQLAFQKGRKESANLFIVGDRKQSIYGFRGADVDVFREMTKALTAVGGQEKPLLLNFRSQPPLIDFFNYLFERFFRPKDDVTSQELEELGYVGHEPSDAKRELRDSGPLVELLITTEASGDDDDPKAEQGSRELDAKQLAQRIIALTGPGTAGVSPALGDEPGQESEATINSDNLVLIGGGRDAHAPREEVPRYSDIALLFRAMTNVQVYESEFRRANIPYQTVLGRGFYEREEIRDLIQLLRFLDNKTDELALAAVLRSPLCGLSDNALLALRCAPWLKDVDGAEPTDFKQTRRLFIALRHHREIALISEDEQKLLDRAADLISNLVARRHHYALSDLLRFAVDQSEYLAVIAATFDGAQRLANVERLFTLAERFERAGTHLIRDFVRYVEEFEAIGSRESEGQIDEATNAVRLMTIHQAKGLEFPIVILPELQRYSKVMDNWVLLDRHRGLTLKVPDGRGRLVVGSTFGTFEQRHAWREQFESMRLLYVAATRAEDRLIFSGTVKDLDSLESKSDTTWLKWIWQSLELPAQTQTGVIDLTDKVQVQLTLNLADQPHALTPAPEGSAAEQSADSGDSLAEAFPLLRAVEPAGDHAAHRFSVTQLINYQRCPRQYYFDRVLHAPAPDALAVWNDAEAPEPPANLTATLKGAVIHRFCETFIAGEETSERLLQSFKDVTAARQAQLAERSLEIDTEKVIKELLPLAENYLASPVFERVEAARKASSSLGVAPAGIEAGLWSELSFRLRRPLGILNGTIDKLLITKLSNGDGFEIEIIDFKSNRISVEARASRPKTDGNDLEMKAKLRARRPRSQDSAAQQFALNFSEAEATTNETGADSTSLEDRIRVVASDYQLQMQAYALAVCELMPSLNGTADRITNRIKVTLHFLDPNVEFQLSDALLDPENCARAIDEAMREIVTAHEPEHFPVRPATHCRMCNFLELCYAGREMLRRQ
jgi:ATP-dependent helicase/nuclease subunit A